MPNTSPPPYDLIVCGAGPSGAMAAAEAARAGLKVALLEKQFLPRHKTCGGGMPMVMEDFLWDLAPEAFVESQVSHMRHTWNFGDACMGAINTPGVERKLSLWMVQRSVFDHALAERAARTGAELRDGIAVQSIDPQPDGVVVHAKDAKTGAAWSAKASYVIGAEGASSVVLKSTQLRKNRVLAVGLEVELPHTWDSSSEQLHADLRPDVLHLEYGAVQRGYGWIFPKADHLNIGAAIFRPDKKNANDTRSAKTILQETIFAYMDAMGLKYDRNVIRFHGHPLPTWSGREPLHEGRVLLVGDAAGLINPFFGDGLLHAVKSGKIAAQAIASNSADTYTQQIHAEFASDFDAALRMSKVFYNWTRFCYKHGVKQDKASHYAAKLLCGEVNFGDVPLRVARRLKKKLVEKIFSATSR